MKDPQTSIEARAADSCSKINIAYARSLFKIMKDKLCKNMCNHHYFLYLVITIETHFRQIFFAIYRKEFFHSKESDAVIL